VWFSGTVEAPNARREVDRTLETRARFLGMRYAAKGTLLLRLPRLWAVDPTKPNVCCAGGVARWTPTTSAAPLGWSSVQQRGAQDEAREQATRALAIAERKQSRQDAGRARPRGRARRTRANP
jgi:hypothetical protein